MMGEFSKQYHYITTAKGLFEGQAQGMITQIYENEFPPCGLAGALDWYFQGSLSKFIQQGFITGKKGECTYLPILKNSVVYHVICVGGGQTLKPGERYAPVPEILSLIQKNLTSLQISKIGISKTDFGDIASDTLTKNLKGAHLWIAP